ncbi:hypothetical protein ACFTWF_08545 [Rhodococcus sp. NPDC056960]|uniref:hypothetical protein n=1 Tax=Rhodococcus sp. NPDC056960 TaxID=3345982 RepID=UPI0036395AE0
MRTLDCPGPRTRSTGRTPKPSTPVARADRAVFVEDPTISGARSWGTVLSLPYAVDAIVPQLADAAGRPA